MTIRVALEHVTRYQYDRPVTVGPQTVRLRPAPHARTPIVSYSLNIEPRQHYLNWQQDPHGNFLARIVVPDRTQSLRIAVNLVADLTVINPFDFFIDEAAELFPFAYESALEHDLLPYLAKEPVGPRLEELLREVNVRRRKTIDFLVSLNQQLQRRIRYVIRMEPGVQTPEETLSLGSGSCRDSAWLMVQTLRQFGMAARFVSGYLIQLTADQPSLDGPNGPSADFTDLHAWAEVFVPGAGWIGLDPTSGLLAGEGHIPLAASPSPESAAPISGGLDACEVEFDVSMSVVRVHEDPRVSKPYADEQWSRIDRVGEAVDASLRQNDVRLTMGGEPTFVSIDDMEGAEWNTAAVGPMKQRLSARLIKRLRERFAPGGMLHFGQGKWYPGESLPRWAFSCLWRRDGQPIWRNPARIADFEVASAASTDDALTFLESLCDRLEVDAGFIRPAYEDIWDVIEKEQRLPVDVDPRKFNLDDDEDRRRIAHVLERGLKRPTGYALPLTRAWWQARASWTSGAWPFRSDRLFLLPGDSPIGLRLPLDSLPAASRGMATHLAPRDPWEPLGELPSHDQLRESITQRKLDRGPMNDRTAAAARRDEAARRASRAYDGAPVVRTALCIEPRDGLLRIFMPPVGTLEDYLDLVAAIEDTAESLDCAVMLEGYLPPPDYRLNLMKATPDPGVIELNVHPAGDWSELKQIVEGVYEEARQSRLGTEKYQLDGKQTGTGGGNHVVLGGATPSDSPFLRRPDLLASLATYWNNHPSLSYLFAGQFIGPTSQAPRVDEGRRDAIYELEIAAEQLRDGCAHPPWLVDRLFRNLFVDVTGNTHRAEFCIDKLFSPDHANGRLGLVELRAMEMPPHARMCLVQQLLVRGLVAAFWERPYRERLIRWGTAIHDRFMLPHYLAADLRAVARELNLAGFKFETDWFAPHWEFRFPKIGEFSYDEARFELRTAVEPWYVLGEEPGGGGTARYVDSSCERMQLSVAGLPLDRYAVLCNGRAIPLTPTDVVGCHVAGIRYRAWQPPNCLHPTIAPHTPLTIDVVDRRSRQSVAGCRYFVGHPGGLNPVVYPLNSLEAECRRAARFTRHGRIGGVTPIPTLEIDSEYPLTLDLRRSPRRK